MRRRPPGLLRLVPDPVLRPVAGPVTAVLQRDVPAQPAEVLEAAAAAQLAFDTA